MVSDKLLKIWPRRLEVVGRAQARYLWILLIAGVFFLAVHFQVIRAAQPEEQVVTVPFVDLQLSSLPIWGVGPAVIFFVLAVLMGSLRAYRTASDVLEISQLGKGEAYDVNPNALDFLVYTTPESSSWLKRWLLFTYPFVVTLFWVEAVWLAIEIWRSDIVLHLEWLYLATAGLLAVPASWRIAAYWARNAKRAFGKLKSPGSNAA
jgi:hypothetical protein